MLRAAFRPLSVIDLPCTFDIRSTCWSVTCVLLVCKSMRALDEERRNPFASRRAGGVIIPDGDLDQLRRTDTLTLVLSSGVSAVIAADLLIVSSRSEGLQQLV